MNSLLFFSILDYISLGIHSRGGCAIFSRLYLPLLRSAQRINDEDRIPLRRKAALDALILLLLPLRLFLVKDAMDRLQQWGEPGSQAALALSCALLALLMTVAAFLGSASLLHHTRIYEVGTLLKERAVVEKTARLPLRLAESPSIQDLRRRALQYSPDATCLEGLGFHLHFAQVVILLGVVGWIGYWPLALLFLAFGALHSLLVSRADARLERLREKQTPSFRLADELHRLLISKAPAKEMRVFGFGSLLRKRWLEAFGEGNRLNRRALFASEKTKLVPETFSAWLGGVAVVAILLAPATGTATAGDCVLLFQCVAMLSGVIPNSARQAGALARMDVHERSFESYLGLEEDRFTDRHAQCGDATQLGVSADRVIYRYGSAADSRPALDRISFAAEPGSSVAIVGENGSGKSTLVKLLLGLYVPDEGLISWRTELGEVPKEEAEARLTVVFQDFYRYRLSLRDNVAVGDVRRANNEEALRSALAKAGAEALSGRLEDIVGTEFGQADLSGGQWQKVAVARALLGAGGFLAFDEPTSALDPRTELRSIDEFLRAARGRTAILVTHRLGAAKLADLIVVMKEGRLVEQGTHEELVSREGEYARLYRVQAAWYA